MTRRATVVLVAFLVSAENASAQSVVRGSVVTAEAANPIAAARVTSLRMMKTVTTDRFGRFAMWVGAFPDTLVVTFIGRAPDTVVVGNISTPLVVALAPAPVPLADVVVSGSSLSHGSDASTLSRWTLPADALRLVPAGVEFDPLRALTLLPAVSYTTPLSARPLIRGYSAEESSFRLDGFEIVNPYHIGRFFGALPGEAVDQVSVNAAPFSASMGGSLAGIIDVTGRSRPPRGKRGGATLSLVSASPWLSGGDETAWFGTARAVYLSALDVVSSKHIPYDFQDVYLGGAISRNGLPRAHLTAFFSRDHLLDQDQGTGMDWNNLLLGTRLRLAEWSASTLELSAAGTRFSEDATNVAARHSKIDVANRSSRIGLGTDLNIQLPRGRVSLGAGAYRRAITNQVRERSGPGFPTSDVALNQTEFNLYGEWQHEIGSMTLLVGTRVDAVGSHGVVQPRLYAGIPLTKSVTLEGGLGRASRLFYMIADPRSEPDVAFYDFWLPIEHNGASTPIVDHASATLGIVTGHLTARVSAFGSSAKGLGELRPETDQDAPAAAQFRFGKGRTRGLEAQVGLAAAGKGLPSLTLSYTLTTSERNWGDGWVPWSQERRHTARLFSQLSLGRWLLFSAAEAASGPPFTPVDQVVQVGIPDSTGLGRFPGYIFGKENSSRSAGTFRIDLGATYQFKGPWSSDMWLGLSVINVGFGPVAPTEVQPPDLSTTRVRYERAFDLPAVPTVTLRVEF